MRKIYLVKKNPELPADGNNWLVMNSFEFRNFIQTPEGQKRRDRFGQLDACSVDDVIIIAIYDYIERRLENVDAPLPARWPGSWRTVRRSRWLLHFRTGSRR